MSAFGGKADIAQTSPNVVFDPKRTFAARGGSPDTKPVSWLVRRAWSQNCVLVALFVGAAAVRDCAKIFGKNGFTRQSID